MASKLQNVSGILELDNRQSGFLRNPERGYAPNPNDARLTPESVRKWGLRGGEAISGQAGSARSRNGRQPAQMQTISSINGIAPEDYLDTKPIEQLTAIDPREALRFETPDGPLSMRVLDLLTPIGRGQRGLIVAPPRTGKTVLLKQIAHGIATNYPDVQIIVLLIDERPEEVTELRRSIKGEVAASSNDHDVASHVRLARLIVSKARRIAECGQHVLLLVDSITRLGRAFNNAQRHSGRIMSGGLDASALQEPKTIFGAARNVEEGGSITIIATALIDTGSRMDEVIFNEFQGTGNMEIVLCRELANKRIWPAINLDKSGTRKEELLLDEATLEASYAIRRGFSGKSPEREMEMLLARLGKTPNNHAFVKAAMR